MKRAATWVASCVLVGCSGASDTGSRQISSEVETQIATARNATIPSGVSLAESSGPTRQGSMVSTEWSFDLPTDWDAYAEATTASLGRAGYEVVNSGQEALALTRHVPGDSYRVRIARKGSASPSRVTVSFSASPD